MNVDAPQDVDLANNAKQLMMVKVNENRRVYATLYTSGGIYGL